MPTADLADFLDADRPLQRVASSIMHDRSGFIASLGCGQAIQPPQLQLGGGVLDVEMRAVIHCGLEQRTGIRW